METLWTALIQLGFVGIVYLAAYRHGFKASQSKSAAIVRQFSTPVDEMLNGLDREIDKALERQKKQNGKA
jgi:hypothetical protein